MEISSLLGVEKEKCFNFVAVIDMPDSFHQRIYLDDISLEAEFFRGSIHDDFTNISRSLLKLQ